MLHPLENPDWGKPKLKPEEILMQAIRFTEDDLEANQNGTISDSQRKRLYERRDLWLYGAFVTGAGIVLLLFVINLSLLQAPFSFFFAYCFYNALMFNSELRLGTIGVVEGRVKLEVIGSKNDVFELRIENHYFPINQEIFLAFKNGDPYRIYFSPQTRLLFSADWLRD